jgi:hypothetical protein
MAKRFPNTAFDSARVTQYETFPHLTAVYQAGVLDTDELTDALNTLKMFRYLAGVPYEQVSFTAKLNKTAQHKAVLLATSNQVSHFPKKPAGMTASFYNEAQSFTKECIFGGKSSIANAINGFIADGGNNNIERAEHRMALFDPGAQRFGIGYAQNPTASYRGYRIIIHIQPSEEESDSYVAWPSAGAFPIQYFAATAKLPMIPPYPWSLKLGSPYQAPSRDNIKLVLTRLGDGQTWIFDDAAPYLSADNMPEDSAHLAVHGKEIIFRPDMTTLSAIRDGDIFTVNLSGIKDAGGQWTTLNYSIHFFDLEKAMDKAAETADETRPETQTEIQPERQEQAQPDKIQILRAGQDIVQYDYYTVMAGGVNRQAFIDIVMGLQSQDRLCVILKDGMGYDVTHITLDEAIRQNRIVSPDGWDSSVSDHSGALTPGAAELIDRINAAYPLNADDMRSVYSIYYQVLSDFEKASVADNAAVLDMFAMLGI